MVAWSSLNYNDEVGREFSPCDRKRGGNVPGSCQGSLGTLGVLFRSRTQIQAGAYPQLPWQSAPERSDPVSEPPESPENNMEHGMPTEADSRAANEYLIERYDRPPGLRRRFDPKERYPMVKRVDGQSSIKANAPRERYPMLKRVDANGGLAQPTNNIHGTGSAAPVASGSAQARLSQIFPTPVFSSEIAMIPIAAMTSGSPSSSQAHSTQAPRTCTVVNAVCQLRQRSTSLGIC